VKRLSKIIVFTSVLIIVISLIPVIFILPFKGWQSFQSYLSYVIFEDSLRWGWQIGTLVLVFFYRRNKQNCRI